MINLLLSKSFYEKYTLNTNLKYLSNWGEAESYLLWNLSAEYEPKLTKGLIFELIGKNLLGENIDLPEIARDSTAVPTIPKNYSAKVYFGMKYEF